MLVLLPIGAGGDELHFVVGEEDDAQRTVGGPSVAILGRSPLDIPRLRDPRLALALSVILARLLVLLHEVSSRQEVNVEVPTDQSHVLV